VLKRYANQAEVLETLESEDSEAGNDSAEV
jgi:hypothetical protein